jgi:uncharacterized iron-regulated membrane protein
MTLLKVHRWVSILAVLFTLYLGVTGSLIQLIDLRGLLLHSSPYDPNLQAMRGDVNGPGDYAVIGPAYYLARPMPADTDYPALFARTLAAARRAAGAAPIRYLELLQADGRIEGIAQLDDHPPSPAAAQVWSRQPPHTILVFDAATGVPLPGVPVPLHNVESQQAPRIVIKSLHRMTTFGNWALWINIFVAAGLLTLIVTGVWVYVRQYRARARMGRRAPFWKAQDWWRTLHRTFSVACALFLTILVASGLWLAVESLVFGYRMADQFAEAKATGRPPSMPGDAFTPLPDAEVPQWARATISSYAENHPGLPPRAVRLRIYAGYAQGVVISGESEARQLVYNARSGAPMRETEPGYPAVGFPFGWQAHQWAKQVHNGSMIGLTGRGISLLSGLALLYLSISGIVMYLRLYRRRARNGRRALFW